MSKQDPFGRFSCRRVTNDLVGFDKSSFRQYKILNWEVRMQHLQLVGHPHEIGLSHGTQLAAVIGRLLAESGYDAAGLRSALAARGQSPEAASHSDPVDQMCRRLGVTLAARCPNLVEEMRGIAEGAGVAYQDILLLNVGFDAEGEFLARAPQCTAVGLPNTEQGPLLAKTEDVNPVQWESQAFFRVRPHQGHAFLVYSLAGTVWVDGGVNEAGLGLVMTGLGAAGPTRPDGLPNDLLLRQILQHCATVDEALALAKANPLRYGGGTMTLADATSGDITVVENLPAARAVRRSSHEPTVRTNHPQCPETRALPRAEGWMARVGIPELLANSEARASNGARLAAEIPRSVAGLQQFLSNHAASGAICQHGQAGLHTAVAMIVIPRQRTLVAAEGYGCGTFVEHAL